MQATEYQDIGHYIHDCRESLRITIAEAAKALHIRAHYLKAIESGELDKLPGKTYIRGYIRKYVEYLGLDVQEVMEAYELLLVHKVQDFFRPEPNLKQNLPSSRIITTCFIGILLVYGYWYFFIHDSSTIENTIPSVSEATLQLLGFKPRITMDSEWEKCLNAGDELCFIHMHYKNVPEPSLKTYDLEPNDLTPQEP